MAASPHKIRGTAPANYLVVPSKLSMWLNATFGCCVTSSEAFKAACAGILIADSTVKAFATKNNVLNGADLDQVLNIMQNAGFVQDGNTYNDGPYTAVDWTNSGLLQNAIATGYINGGLPTPVKIGVDGDPLNTLYDQVFGSNPEFNGWLATGFAPTTVDAEDHCVELCGYGSIEWLLAQFGKPVPSGVDGTQAGYGLYTWDAIGVIDYPSMVNITHEAWLRNPSSVTVGTGTPTPDSVTIFGGGGPVNPPPGPSTTQSAVMAAISSEFAAAGTKYPHIHPQLAAISTAVSTAVNAAFAANPGSIRAVDTMALIAALAQLAEAIAVKNTSGIIAAAAAVANALGL